MAKKIEETLPETTTDTETPAVIDDAAAFLEAQAETQEPVEVIPRLKIEQKNPEHLGKLYSEDVAQSWDSMDLVVLRVSDSRILWPETFSKDNVPACKSNDSITPVPLEDIPADDQSGYDVKADSCEKCPFSGWSTVGGKRVPPACNESKDLLVIDRESMIPFFISFSSLGLSAVNKQLLRPLRLRVMALSAQRRSAGLPPAHTAMFGFKLSTLFDERDSGTSYQPIFSNLEELSDEDKDMFVQVAIATQQYDAHSRPDDKGGEGGEGGGDDSYHDF